MSEIEPPKSPVPPLKINEQPLAFETNCKFCNKVTLIIARERISDDITTGRTRYRYVPREKGNEDIIHNCRHSKYRRMLYTYGE